MYEVAHDGITNHDAVGCEVQVPFLIAHQPSGLKVRLGQHMQ